jgi:hypothetical protein
MLDLGLLEKALEGDGKDADEARLRAVEDNLVSDVLEAASTARIGLEKGTTDVRLLTAYALGAFVEQGPKTLPAIYDALRKAVTERWHSLRPEESKARTVDGSYSKLFRSLISHIDVHEKMQDATFKAWIRSDHETVGGPALRASAALREALTGELATALSRDPLSKDPLSELDARVRMHFDRHPAPAKPAPRPAPEPEAVPSTDEASSPESPPEQAKDTVSDHGADDARKEAPAHTIAVSPAFAQLLRKIDAVGALLSRGDTERAAVVADDVRRTLKQFDPKVFFPDVFLPYFRLLSENIQEIAPHWDGIGNPRWEALAQLYEVSLDAFLEG